MTGAGLHAAAARPRPLRVMIVEDDAIIALDIEMTLQSAGHEVVGTARTAAQAMGIVRDTEIDVAICDIRLADETSGIDVATALRLERGIGSIFLSGNATPDMRARLSALDPVATLSKPFTQHGLLAAVAAAG